MPMQPRPIAETSRPFFPIVRFVIVDASCEVACSLPFPRNPPMFVGAGRLDDQLIAGELVQTLQVLPDQTANQRAFDMERPGLRAFVDVVAAIRGFVSALRVL